MNESFDVIIVGGGLVGASLAHALAPLDLKVALLEAVDFRSSAQPSYDDRMLALAQGSKRILDTMGIWPEVISRGASAIKSIHISDRGHPGFTRLEHEQFDVEALGYVVSARVLGQALMEEFAEKTGTRFFCPAQATALDVQADLAHITIKIENEEHSLSTALLVLADGGDSKTRAMAGIQAQIRDYGQSAVVTTVATNKTHDGRAYERFTEHGPMALLPAADRRFGVVWTNQREQVDGVLALDDAQFIAQLQSSFGGRAGELSDPGKRRAYPLRLIEVAEPVRPRIAVIGNAAHTVHPVAGQGFNLGLRDVAVLADVLADAVAANHDLGDLSVLEKYQSWRQRDTKAVTYFTDGLIHLFANDFVPAVALRTGLMWMVDTLPFVKRRLVRRTMGLSGRLPRLACGVALT